MNTPNLERWLAVYTESLVATYANDAQWLATLRNNPRFSAAQSDGEAIAMLAARMTEGLPDGRSNKDTDAIRRTCKALGIKHTYKAIKEYLQ